MLIKKCHPVPLHSTERKEEKDWPGKEGAGFGDLFKCEKTFVHQLLGRRWRRGREETLPVGKRGKRWFLGVFRSFFRFPIQGQFVNLSFWEHEKRLYFSFQAPYHVPPLSIKEKNLRKINNLSERRNFWDSPSVTTTIMTWSEFSFLHSLEIFDKKHRENWSKKGSFVFPENLSK